MLRCGVLGPTADPKDSCSLGTVKPDPAQEGSGGAHTLSEALIFYPTASKDTEKSYFRKEPNRKPEPQQNPNRTPSSPTRVLAASD